MKKSFAVLLFLPFFGCIKSTNNSSNENGKEKPLFKWVDFETKQEIVWDFHKDTTMIIGNDVVRFTCKKGKGLVEINPVEKGAGQRVQAENWYFVNGDVYIGDGSALTDCNVEDCVNENTPSYTVILGTTIKEKPNNEYCIYDTGGSDLKAITRDNNGLGRYSGSISLKVRASAVSSATKKYFQCWMETDPVETVSIVNE